jgi:hypothetical protein
MDSPDDLPASFRAALRQRGASLAILECAVDPEVVAAHTEARLRAERRLGEILGEVRERSLRDRDVSAFGTLLAEHGVSRDQADRWQRLALMPADEFARKIVKRVAVAVAGLANVAPARTEVME